MGRLVAKGACTALEGEGVVVCLGADGQGGEGDGGGEERASEGYHGWERGGWRMRRTEGRTLNVRAGVGRGDKVPALSGEGGDGRRTLSKRTGDGGRRLVRWGGEGGHWWTVGEA